MKKVFIQVTEDEYTYLKTVGFVKFETEMRRTLKALMERYYAEPQNNREMQF
jgi:hypothetical protein